MKLRLVFLFAALASAGLAGEVVCASAESMAGLMESWARSFNALHASSPAAIKFRAKYSADFVDALARGKLSVAPFARELFPAEVARIRELSGREPRLVPVATGSRATKGGTHAIAIFVNAKNPLAHISLVQLREIFSQGGKITTWGQLGLRGEWADRKISLHGMKVRRASGNPPGIVNFLESRLLSGRPWRDDVREHVDVTGGAQSLDLITRAVAEDESGIGYSGFAYAVPGVKSLALGETDAGPFFEGTESEIARHDYPLTRTIYLCTGPAPDAATRKFVRHALSPQGQAAIVSDRQKFFPLTASDVLPAYEPRPFSAPQGKHYLRPDGAVAIVGYNDMEQMLTGLCAKFSACHPGFQFALSLKGTRTAPPALAHEESGFAPMGAEFSPQELAAYRAATGSEPRVFRVAHCSIDPRALSGPLALIVPRSSPRSALTLDEAKEIFSGRANHDLHPVGLERSTALGIFFRKVVLGADEFAADFHGAAQSSDVVALVAADPQAIGFTAAMRVTPEVRTLALAEGTGESAILPTEENLRRSRYALDRFLLIYVREPIAPWLREYLSLVLSREGQAVVAGGSLGYLPLNAAEIAAERTQLD